MLPDSTREIGQHHSFPNWVLFKIICIFQENPDIMGMMGTIFGINISNSMKLGKILYGIFKTVILEANVIYE